MCRSLKLTTCGGRAAPPPRAGGGWSGTSKRGCARENHQRAGAAAGGAHLGELLPQLPGDAADLGQRQRVAALVAAMRGVLALRLPHGWRRWIALMVPVGQRGAAGAHDWRLAPHAHRTQMPAGRWGESGSGRRCEQRARGGMRAKEFDRQAPAGRGFGSAHALLGACDSVTQLAPSWPGCILPRPIGFGAQPSGSCRQGGRAAPAPSPCPSPPPSRPSSHTAPTRRGCWCGC
jgi:hypothetical protein